MGTCRNLAIGLFLVLLLVLGGCARHEQQESVPTHYGVQEEPAPEAPAMDEAGTANESGSGLGSPVVNESVSETAGSSGQASNDSVMLPEEPPPTFKEFNLEVVFYDVTTCYVAESCNGEDCDTINDYRDGSEIMRFKNGTLRTLEKAKADSYGYGTEHGVKKCVTSSFPEEAREELQSYVNEMAGLVYSWSGGRMKIVPHFHSVAADMGGGPLNREGGITNYETGKNPGAEKFIYYAKKAGVDPGNMDMFVAFTNSYPQEGSPNDGLLVQSYIGETSGTFNGVPMVKLSGMASADRAIGRDWMIPVLIHELLHVINIGHYSVSGLEDVYGIQNSESNPHYDPETNPRPHCTATEHYDENGNPDPYRYFPDSYNWLDPMWNERPFEPFQEGGDTVSYCLEGPDAYPDVNPLNASDRYEDIEGLNENCKYYKFVFQAHYQDAFIEKLYTSFCRNGRLDNQTLDYNENFEYTTDTGGGCLNKNYQCRPDGLCLDLEFGEDGAHDLVNELPVKSENVATEKGAEGTVGAFRGNSELLVSGADFFADSEEMTIDLKTKLDSTDGIVPLITDIDRYYIFVDDGHVRFMMQDWLLYEVNSMPTEKNVRADIALRPDEWYDIKVVYDHGIGRIYINGTEAGNNEGDPFRGKFMYQDNGDFKSHVYVGYNMRYITGSNSWLNGEIKEIRLYNKVV